MPELKVEDEDLQAAEQAYDAYNKGFAQYVPWNEINESEQENWKRVAIAVIEFVDLRRAE